MDQATVEQNVLSAIAEVVGRPVEEIDLNAELARDLDLSYLDLAKILFSLDITASFRPKTIEKLETVNDIVALRAATSGSPELNSLWNSIPMADYNFIRDAWLQFRLSSSESADIGEVSPSPSEEIEALFHQIDQLDAQIEQRQLMIEHRKRSTRRALNQLQETLSKL